MPGFDGLHVVLLWPCGQADLTVSQRPPSLTASSHPAPTNDRRPRTRGTGGKWGRYPHGVGWPVTDAPVALVRLSAVDAGEVLTLQRAAYVTEAQAHGDLALPPLVQSLAELAVELTDPKVLALGLREGARLVAAVRVRIEDEAAELGRLVVAPDQQRHGLGSRLLREAEKQVPERVQLLRLFTGEHSAANQRLYKRHGYAEDHRSSGGEYQLVHMTKVLRHSD